jgi:2-keto-4-pentenoate hydratase/2-oxohepta-3-ene-1,7-dioic acid hydratase in catechol pathway
MKIIRYLHKGEISYGVIESEYVVPIKSSPWIDDTLDSLVMIPINDVLILAPCIPGKVVSIALNYPGITGATNKNNEPLIFIKPSTSVIGPQDIIVSPFRDTKVWGECELAVVIGKLLKNAKDEEVQDGIYGYTVGNDVSSESVGGRDHHLARSKAADTFCVLGPWIDTEFSPDQQMISGYHNESLLREGHLNERLWKEIELIKWLSTWITLEPGDVVLTGAPSRVRDREYLKNGDNFRCVIEGLGELKNSFEEVNE